MANPHFANLGDVWKHLLLTEVISWLQPGHYVETHAGSALYALTDDLERGLGAELFLTASSEIEPLRSSPYRRNILGLARGAAPSYPGSPLLAMMLLGRACRYVFCDTDPSSVADLRAARERLGLQKEVQVIHGDGLAEQQRYCKPIPSAQPAWCTSTRLTPMPLRRPPPARSS